MSDADPKHLSDGDFVTVLIAGFSPNTKYTVQACFTNGASIVCDDATYDEITTDARGNADDGFFVQDSISIGDNEVLCSQVRTCVITVNSTRNSVLARLPVAISS